MNQQPPIWDRVFETIFDSGDKGISLKELPALVNADYQSCWNNVREMRMAGMIQDQWVKPECGGRPRKLVRIDPEYLLEITLPTASSVEYRGHHAEAQSWTPNQVKLYQRICRGANHELTREDLAKYVKLSYAQVCVLLRPMIKAGIVIDMDPPFDGFDGRAKRTLRPNPHKQPVMVAV